MCPLLVSNFKAEPDLKRRTEGLADPTLSSCLPQTTDIYFGSISATHLLSFCQAVLPAVPDEVLPTLRGAAQLQSARSRAHLSPQPPQTVPAISVIVGIRIEAWIAACLPLEKTA